MSQTKAQLISDLVQALAFTATASAPTNGIFLSASNTLSFSTNSTERLQIDSNGELISVRGSFLRNVNTGELVLAGGNATNAGANIKLFGGAHASTPNILVFRRGSTESMRIDSSGNVGIGVSSPSAFLDVESASDQTVLRLRNNGGNNTKLLFANKSAGLAEIFYQGDFRFVDDENSDAERLRIDSSGDLSVPRAASGYMFQTGNAIRAGIRSNDQNELIFKRGSDTTGMVLTSTGLGIGTTSPASTLHTSGSSDQTVTIQTTTSGADSRINFRNNSGTDAGGIFYKHNGNHLTFHTGGSLAERVRIDSTGRVGIGTTSPSELLHIAGATNPAITLQDTTNNTDARIKTNNNGDLVFEADYNNEQSDSRIGFETDGSEKVRIDSSGNVGIGTTSPNHKLTLATTSTNTFDALNISSGNTNSTGYQIGIDSSSNVFHWNTTNSSINFATNNAERVRIDGSGRLLVGTNTNIAPDGFESKIQTAGTDYRGGSLSIRRDQATASGPTLTFTKSRSTVIGGTTIVQNGDVIGQIAFYGADGGDVNQAAGYIRSRVDGTPAGNDMPGRLEFHTTADGAASPTERMRIANDGKFFYATTSQGPHGGFFNIDASSSGRNGLNVQGTTANYVMVSSAGGNTGDHIHFSNYSNSNQETGRIKDNQSNVTYHTSSDYRLKDNIVSITDGITRVKQLNPVRHTWINNPSLGTVDGWIAHELDAVCPDAVDGVKDAVKEDGSINPQAVDYGRITPLLAAALKEAIAKIETLETKVAALEAE